MKKIDYKLRPPIKEDITAYSKFVSDQEVSIWLEDEVQKPLTIEQIEDFLLKGWFRWSITNKEDRFIGVTGIDLVNSLNSIGRFFIVIGDKSLWGKGIGSCVIKDVVDYGFNKLKLRKINSDFLSPNEAVKIIHEKAGFRHEGVLRDDAYRHGEWVDRMVMSILAKEYFKKD